MLKVLLVEDEHIIRQGLIYEMDWMEQGFLMVGEAGDGETGLEKIQELKPDIVITDIRMPFKDGLKMIEEGLEIHHFDSIILTGYGEFEYAQTAISLGVTEYILKPVDFNLLRQTLQKLKANRQKTTVEAGETEFNWNGMSENRQISPYTQKVIEFIQLHYAEKVTLSQASEACAISSVHLNTKLKADTQFTFTELLNRYRIMKAVEMMRQEHALIYEVAEAVGFKDYKYFSSVFKKYTGASPSAFMK